MNCRRTACAARHSPPHRSLLAKGRFPSRLLLRYRLLVVLLAAGVCLCGPSCRSEDVGTVVGPIPSAATPEQAMPKTGLARDIVFITVDTLRADHCDIYGYERETTPAVAAFFREGTVYERCYATTSRTASSVTSFLSGLLPLHHHVRAHMKQFPSDLVLVSDLLQQGGYQTAGFVATIILANSRTGLGRHFDHYDDKTAKKTRHFYERTSKDTTDAVLAWLRGKRDSGRPLFLWVHYMDPHAPYEPPEDKPRDFTHAEPLPVPMHHILPYARYGDCDDGLDYVDRYDEEIATCDREIGRLLRACEAAGMGRGLFILSADHGETLAERPHKFRHSYHVYEELIHVPLLVRGPGFRAGRVAEPVSIIDIPPTILRFAGLPVPGDIDGTVLTQEPPKRLVFAESDWYDMQGQYRCVIDGATKWTVLLHPTKGPETTKYLLYELNRDPGETKPSPWAASEKGNEPGLALLELVDEDADIVRPAAADLTEIPEPEEPLDEEALKALRALGYVH